MNRHLKHVIIACFWGFVFQMLASNRPQVEQIGVGGFFLWAFFAYWAVATGKMLMENK